MYAAQSTPPRQAEHAGAQSVKAAGPAFWGGYASDCQNPDGYLWEVAWNPQPALPE